MTPYPPLPEEGQGPAPRPGPDYYGQRLRSIRVTDELWDAAAEVAAAEGTDLSKVLRDCLARYVRRAHRRAQRGHGKPSNTP